MYLKQYPSPTPHLLHQSFHFGCLAGSKTEEACQRIPPHVPPLMETAVWPRGRTERKPASCATTPPQSTQRAASLGIQSDPSPRFGTWALVSGETSHERGAGCELYKERGQISLKMLFSVLFPQNFATLCFSHNTRSPCSQRSWCCFMPSSGQKLFQVIPQNCKAKIANGQWNHKTK